MCYDIKASYESQLKRAKQRGDLIAIEEILEKLIPLTDLPIYHITGFSHPELLIYTWDNPNYPIVATWGLAPPWIQDEVQMRKYWNNTLNARLETIFEKPSFIESAKQNKCIIYIDGYYEHHHFNNKTFPFYIQRKDKKPIALGGLWSEWTDLKTRGRMNTFTIVTTTGNTLMSKIHNNPKNKESRMPLILNEAQEDSWLKPIETKLDKEEIQEIMQSNQDNELIAYTVGQLRGKKYKGNVEEISKEVVYDDLEF